MAKTPQQIGQSTPGSVDTDNASKQAFTQTIVSGTAFQISTTQPAHLYIDIATAAAMTIAIGPTSTPATTILNNHAATIGLLTVLIPAGFWVKITGTVANFAVVAVID